MSFQTHSYKQTIGLDFFVRHIELPSGVNVAMQVWDIGGQSIGSKMVQNYIFGADAVLFVYDLTNHDSFDDLEDWKDMVDRACALGDKDPHKALIANKSDLTHMRSVKPDEHQHFAVKHAMRSHFLSAKTGDNVEASFYRIAADLAGVAISKREVEVASKVVDAQVSEQVTLQERPGEKQHDRSKEQEPSKEKSGSQSQSKGCALM